MVGRLARFTPASVSRVQASALEVTMLVVLDVWINVLILVDVVLRVVGLSVGVVILVEVVVRDDVDLDVVGLV
jgi:hypothetical protein